jgi:hypothetical protein
MNQYAAYSGGIIDWHRAFGPWSWWAEVCYSGVAICMVLMGFVVTSCLRAVYEPASITMRSRPSMLRFPARAAFVAVLALSLVPATNLTIDFTALALLVFAVVTCLTRAYSLWAERREATYQQRIMKPHRYAGWEARWVPVLLKKNTCPRRWFFRMVVLPVSFVAALWVAIGCAEVFHFIVAVASHIIGADHSAGGSFYAPGG